MFRFGCQQYVYVVCCRLLLLGLCVSLIYGEYVVNVHFGDIPHTSIPHFTFIPQKNPHRIFRKLPLDNFAHSAKYPFTSYRQSASTTDTRLAAAGKMASAYVCAVAHSSSDNSAIHYVTYFLLVLWMTSCFHMIGHKQNYTSLFTKQVAKNNKEKNNKRNKYSNLKKQR